MAIPQRLRGRTIGNIKEEEGLPERGPMSVTPGSRPLWRPYRCIQLYFHESKKATALSMGDTEKLEKKNLRTLASFPELHRGQVTFLRSHTTYG